MEDSRHVHHWRGPAREIQAKCEEEVEALVELSDDNQGSRSLVGMPQQSYPVLAQPGTSSLMYIVEG